MSNMLRTRGPAIALVAAVMGGLWWQTSSGFNQPHSRAQGPNGADISGTLQKAAGTGGAVAGTGTDPDPKDTRMASGMPNAPSKRDRDSAEHGSKMSQQPGVSGIGSVDEKLGTGHPNKTQGK